MPDQDSGVDAQVSPHASSTSAVPLAVGERNDELHRMNAQLQLARQQVETANEKLASLNDELRTRNQELTLLSNDLTNLLTGIDLPVVMLDSTLRLRRISGPTPTHYTSVEKTLDVRSVISISGSPARVWMIPRG